MKKYFVLWGGFFFFCLFVGFDQIIQRYEVTFVNQRLSQRPPSPKTALSEEYPIQEQEHFVQLKVIRH